MGNELVECHSGYTYAERPVSLFWQEERLVIEKIEARWQTPHGKHFRVRTGDGQKFELVYSERDDAWRVTLV